MKTATFPISIEKTQHSRLATLDFNNIPFGKIFSDHMLVATYEEGQWQTVKIMPYGGIEMAPSLSALHYGQAVFEGMKAYKSPSGKPLLFRPDANYIKD
jgi:branched-chain amino acid aminotransferase